MYIFSNSKWSENHDPKPWKTLDLLEKNRGLSRGPAQEHYMAAKCPVFLADWMKVEKASTHNKYKSGDRLSFCVSLEIIDLENHIKKFL